MTFRSLTKLLSVSLLLSCLARIALAGQTIPAARTFGEAWRQAGYPGAIPCPEQIVNVLDYGAAGNGTANDQPAVAAALSALGGAPGVVYFPAGTYLIQSTIQMPDGAVLRGERSGTTTLLFDFVTHCINIAVSPSGGFQALVSGYEIHSNRIEVTDGSVFTAGDYVEIREENDPAWGASDWADNVVGQIARLTSVSGNDLTLARPLRITYRPDLNPVIRRISPRTECGVENLKLERLSAGTADDRDNQFTIRFSYAARCWVRGVEFENGFGGNVGAQYSTAIEVTGCYIHHARDVDGGGSGYGVRLELRTGDCLVENNVFQSLRHSMLIQAGANGNVFGYNYSREATRSEWPNDLSSDITGHGNYVYANLFEGNICQHIWIDASHGANGPLNTFFRNRAERYGFNMTDNLTHGQNVVGNETFTGTWAIFVGDGYSLKGIGIRFEYGNNTEPDGMEPDGTGDLADYTYYLGLDPATPPTVPAFWTSAGSIPPIGPPHDLNPAKAIPAYDRYLAGGSLTVAPPSLGSQPADTAVEAGQTATFSVMAGGTPAPVYAWHRNGTALAGETGSVLSLEQVSVLKTGAYHVVVSDAHGSVTSAPADLVVTAPTLVPPNRDDDGDGMADAWELWFFGSTNALQGQAAGHADEDPAPNRDEYYGGTDPTASNDVLRLQLDGEGNVISVRFPAVKAEGPGYDGLQTVFDLLQTDDPRNAVWQPVPGYSNIVGNSANVEYTLPAPVASGHFRVRVRLTVAP